MINKSLKRLLLVPVLIGLSGAPAFAKPTVIAELGSAPLLGSSASTAEMRALVAKNGARVAAAAAKIGLTPAEYAGFRKAIDSSRAAWVVVPRHLDAMTWQAGGKVYALHDVIIPAGTRGWEVDVRSHDQILALYMPAKCGNLSLIRKPAPPVVAHRPVPVRVAALKVAPAEAVAPAPPPADVPAAEVPDDTPAAPAQVAAAEFPPAPAATHRPIFLAPLLFGLAALAGGGGNGPIVAPPVGCP